MPEPQQFKVEDVKVGAEDLTQEKIELIYAKVRPHYAVYRNRQRVVVQWADGEKEAEEQRSRVAPLNVLRTDIGGLIDGWRRDTKQIARAHRYDARVASALIVALEGDPGSAVAALTQTKSDILDERTSAGRFDQLISGFSLQILFVLAVLICLALVNQPFLIGKITNNYLLLACGAGAIGAFFSLAIGIRSRTVLPNMLKRDNVLDPIVRGVIGIIAAGVLYALLHSGLVTLVIGSILLSGPSLTAGKAAIIGFLAGFLERLVPDLLEKASITDRAPTPQPVPQNRGTQTVTPPQPPGTPGARATSPPTERPPSPDPRAAVG